MCARLQETRQLYEPNEAPHIVSGYRHARRQRARRPRATFSKRDAPTIFFNIINIDPEVYADGIVG
jgi:hypothetical protein